ncbi:unnamed protein product [Parascedosporium putredinis]|uniref:Delta(24(24(1)))-sterol reductase n=1 Tax=Parascedosporium putredinis TaxID=1442378 RepID=A0A9P1MAD8_9PEZI|nr:unnamed protein product [Parascedosporium putredinis]CAI7992574.1 unnamed protein product [Parascedosporium putredinis]
MVATEQRRSVKPNTPVSTVTMTNPKRDPDAMEGIPPNHIEFGGSPGAASLMIGFPLLMWYMWIGATYYDGGLPLPASDEPIPEFLQHLAGLVYEGAFPTLRAWKIYWVFFFTQMAFYYILPGVEGYGKPLHHEGGKQLKYFCNAYASLYATIILAGFLHVSNLFPLSTLIDEFGSIMSVAILSGFLNSILVYAYAMLCGKGHHLKMFYEVRIPWFILLLISSAAAVRQYEAYGYVSGEVLFLVMAHYLYANACAKGEQLIITSWDMYFEKLGFMLTFWNMAGVPFSYCQCVLYLANNHPDTYRWSRTSLGCLVVLYLFVYWVWDTANGQKNGFRQMERGQLISRKTFPQLPWQIVQNPRVIETDTGDRILADGWSPFPWFYPVFFTIMIVHRTRRDIAKCRGKYGKAWEKYERQVPYLYIPALGTPGYEFLYSTNVTLGERWSYGDFGQGTRVAIPITGGTFVGPRLSGTIVNLGADWGVTDTYGVFFPDTRYSLRTDDGADIFIQTAGPTQEDGRTLLRAIYQTGHPDYIWLNHVVAIGILRRPTGENKGKYVEIDMWQVTLPVIEQEPEDAE